MSRHDQRSPRPPRNYFSRSEQYRLLVLVFSLLIVLVLMFEAAQPSNWEWMWHGTSTVDDTEDATIDTRIPPTTNTDPADVFVSPSSNDSPRTTQSIDGMLDAVARVDLSEIRDNTVLRGVELAAWNQLLDVLECTDSEALATSSIGPVGFTQLFRQPDEYRGKTVTVAGTVRRAFPLNAIDNEFGIQRYWQCWLFPDGSLNPMVVYALEMPDEFPTGMAVRERVEFDGIFFKRWAYAAKRDTRTAPLVLAKSPRWQSAPAIPLIRSTSAAEIAGAWLFALIAAGAITWLIWSRTRWLTVSSASEAFDAHETIDGMRASDSGPSQTGMAVFWWLLLGVTLSCADPVVSQTAAQETTPVASPAKSAQQYLELFGLHKTELAAAANTVSRAQEHDQEHAQALLNVFHCLRRCPTTVLLTEAVAADQWLPPTRSALPGQVVRLRARLETIAPVDVPDDLQNRAGQPLPYHATVVVEGSSDQTVHVIAQSLPKRWAPLDARQLAGQRVGCVGLLLQYRDSGTPTVATNRLAWHPEAASPTLSVEADEVLLANHGLDVGQLDEVQPRGPLTAADRAAFYQTLLAVGRIREADVRAASRDVNVTELLQNTDQQRGKFFEITGTARRCVRILVDEPDVQSEFGISSYYELVVFADPDAIVKVRSTDESEGKYFATYPVVICVRNLPEGFPQGEDIHAGVNVVGCYLKMWAYPSQFMQTPDTNSLQFSPLLIGKTPKWIRSTAMQDPLAGPTIPILFAAALFFLCGLVWWWSRGDQRFKRETLSRKYDLPAGVALDEQALDELEEPDRPNQ